MALLLKRFAASLGLKLEDGEDDLDSFVAVQMELSVTGMGTVHFALWNHEANPPDTCSTHMPLGRDNELLLSIILEEVRVPSDAILWLDRAGELSRVAGHVGQPR